MALPASDNFNRANENPIGGNWTNGYRAGVIDRIQLLSNVVRSVGDTDGYAWWSADTFNADHYAECKVIGVDCGPAVRCSLSGAYYWTPYSDGEVWKYYYDTSGHWAKIGEANTTVTSSDVVRISATGTGSTVTLKVYKNGSLVATLTDTSASRLTSGAAGVYSIGTNTLDDWAADNVSSALAGGATGTGTASGSLGGSLPMTGAATGSAAVVGTATGTADGAITGSATGATTVSGAMTGAGALTGAITGSAAVVASISGGSELTGAITGLATVAGAMIGAGRLAGAITATAAVSGVASGSSVTFDHDVSIGNGYSDVTPRQSVRTSSNYLYAASWKFDTFAAGGIGGSPYNAQTLMMYKADQIGIPSSFTRKDSTHEPSGVVSWAMAVDAYDNIHVIYTTRSEWNDTYTDMGTDDAVKYVVYSTATDTWGTPESIETSQVLPERGQGDELVSIAVDASSVVHILYLKWDGTRRRVTYRNNSGGTWSSAATVDDQSFSAGYTCWHPGIAFDTSGRIVVTWIRGTDGIAEFSETTARIFVRVYSGGSWGTTVDVVGANVWRGIDTGTPIYIDNSNRYHICYISVDKYDQYRFSDDLGATWTANHPASGAYLGDNPAPGPGANGKVRIYTHGLTDDNFPVVYWEGDGGSSSWGTVATYANTHLPNDCSVNVRWYQYHNRFPSHLDVLYWESDYPTNALYLGVDVSGTDPLAGAATGTAAVTGAMTGAGALSGAVVGSATLSGALLGGISTSGAITGAATVSGTLTGVSAAEGAATSTGAATGTLAGAGALAGLVTCAADVVGTITGLGSNALNGAATGTANVTGALIASLALVGDAAGAASVSGTLSGSGALEGSSTGTATVSGSTSTGLQAVGIATGAAAVEATLTASSVLAGDIYASATADATLTASGVLLGSVTGTATLYGLLIDGAWHASGTRTIYKADKRADIEPTVRVSIMAED